VWTDKNRAKYKRDHPPIQRVLRPFGALRTIEHGAFVSGAVAYKFLPIAALPSIEYPTIRVSASRPGADASIMAATVLQAVAEMHLPDTLRAEFASDMRVFAESAAAEEILILAVPARSPRGFPASALDGGGKHRGRHQELGRDVAHPASCSPSQRSARPARSTRAQRRSRPARFRAAEGLVLTAASTTARWREMGTADHLDVR
jgi:AcrB/AcrD/AcrF family